MAQPRSDTGSLTKEPHSVSLKVLRLSRPSLSQQRPNPKDVIQMPETAPDALSNNAFDQDFLISPNFMLPPAFGLAYVGEIFSCSLCANNELLKSNTSKSVSGVRITADMQTPSQSSFSLPILGHDDDTDRPLGHNESIQRIIRYDLKEEGVHVLAVNLTYTETFRSEDMASAGKVRSFRKLYQFQAQPCLSVRTKATELASKEIPDESLGPYNRSLLVRYVLEAQLENVAEGTIVLEQTKLLAYPPFKAKSLNADMEGGQSQQDEQPFLKPREVFQLAFLLEQEGGNLDGLEELQANMKRDGRTALGQIALEWRSAMGEKGQLTTGTLFSRKKA